jgi:hypothetical protein
MTGVTIAELFDEGGTWNAAGLYVCGCGSSASSIGRHSTISIFTSKGICDTDRGSRGCVDGLWVPVGREGRLGGGAGVMEARDGEGTARTGTGLEAVRGLTAKGC